MLGNFSSYNRVLSFVAMVTLSLTISAQKPGSIWPVGEPGKDYNVLDSKGKKQGPWIRIYDKSKILYYRGQFKDGVPHGEFIFYYDTGEISGKAVHVQDTTIVDFTGFHTNGRTKMSEGRYLGSKVEGVWKRRKNGIWKFYDASGILRTEENYKNDLQDGLSKTYFGSGQPLGEFNYQNGKKHGAFVEWYENGNKKSEGFYENDNMHGNLIMFNDKGKKEAEGAYENGLKNGRWLSYHPTGSIEMQIKYELGKEVMRRYENGTFMEYYPSGIPKSEYTYDQGKKDGPFMEWYDIGAWETVPATMEEMEQGITGRQKLSGTKVKMEGNYMNDQLEGDILYYDEKGALTKKEIWTNGILSGSRE